MRATKRALCLILATFSIYSLCACGGNSEPIEVPTENPVELAKAKLEEAYNTCCKGSKTVYAKLEYDGISLTVDTSPNDTKYSSYEADAIAAIQRINLYLALPASLLEKMSSTRVLGDTHSQNCGTYTVTWNYHSDNGLKVIYEVNAQ